MKIVVDKDGQLGIGQTTPAYPLHMGSGAYVTTGGVWTNASSREYKENIEELSANDAMLAFNDLKPVTFNYKTDKTDTHIGFIAEDVPDIVATKDRKGLSPMDMVALLTKVVQEQQKLVQEQQKTIAELSDRVKSLENQDR
ncbi:MAG: tail fiber domain-containing protein [Nitrospirae bacterium]|nr:tail fiber domain-containing protein [Nitrospirota bacterium]